MTTKRTHLVLGVLLAYGIFIFIVYLWVMPKQPLTSRLTNEQEIYTALISEDNAYGERTSLGEIDLSAEIIQYIRDHAPQIEDSTLDDFQKTNRQSYILKDYLSANSSYLLLSDAEVKLYFDDWEAFSRKFPDTRRFVSFSRIGFNSSYSQAIVLKNSYVKLFDAPFEYGGRGLLCLFRKIRGKWVEQYQLVVSITG